MKIKFYAVGMVPFLVMFNYFIIKLVYSSTRLFGLAGLSLIGIGLILILGVVLLFVFRNNPVLQLMMGLLNEIWMIFIVMITVLNLFQYFTLLFITSLWNGIFGIFLIRDAFRIWKNRQTKDRKNFKEKKVKIATVLFSLILLSGVLLSVSPFFRNTSHSFEVTDTQAQNYELVLYYPANQQGVNACRDANATLSFNLVQDLLNGSNPEGEELANVVEYANTQGVPIEIWPLFNRSSGYHYISAKNTDRLWGLYADFLNWTDYYNITVDYLLWDIEDWVHGEDLRYDGWAQNIPFLNSIGNLSMYGVTLNENLRNWDAIIAEWKLMAINASANNVTMRGTVNPSSWEYADGDLDYSIVNHMPSYELYPEFQYISQMVYTGCEWGMAAGGAGPEYVYKALTQIKRVMHPDAPLAVCLGCINYVQYQNISAVKNDVMLALAAGADAVRLFQGWSWVNGWEGPAHGYDGLNDLLQACRTGGTGTYMDTGKFEMMYVSSTISDIIVDFFKW